MDTDTLRTLYDYLTEHPKRQDVSPIQQYLNTFRKSVDYYELVARIMLRFDVDEATAKDELKHWLNNAAPDSSRKHIILQEETK